jgi:integrase
LRQFKRAGASAATANRHLALIRAILRRARDEWEWIEKAPKIKLYREAKRRVRWITPEQAQALLAELPEHQREMVLFALATGLRQGNVTGLRWSQVDLARMTAWVHGEDVKNGDDLHVSLNDLAINVLRRQQGKHPEHVFTYKGKPIHWANTRGWRSALVRAGIANSRWHDLRHTWASWLIQHGTPLYDLQEMGGWKSAEMVRRYAHLAPAKMARNAAAIDDLLNVTTTSQRRLEGEKKGATEHRNPLILQYKCWWASRESNTAPTDYEFASKAASVGNSRSSKRRLVKAIVYNESMT